MPPFPTGLLPGIPMEVMPKDSWLSAVVSRCLYHSWDAARQPGDKLLGISGSPGALFRIESYEYTWNTACRGQLGTDHYSRHDSKRTGKPCPFSSFAKNSSKFSSEMHQKAKSQGLEPFPNPTIQEPHLQVHSTC